MLFVRHVMTTCGITLDELHFHKTGHKLHKIQILHKSNHLLRARLKRY